MKILIFTRFLRSLSKLVDNKKFILYVKFGNLIFLMLDNYKLSTRIDWGVELCCHLL